MHRIVGADPCVCPGCGTEQATIGYARSRADTWVHPYTSYKSMLYFLMLLLVSILLTACKTTQNQNQQNQTLNAELSAAYNIEQGITYLEAGDTVRAKGQFTQALKQAPEMPAAHYAMAYYFEQTGNMQSADASYKTALKLDPQDGDTLNNYATYLCRQGHFAQAEKTFMQAVEDPRFLGTAFAYQNAGLCLLAAKNIEKSEAYFSTALAIDPQMSDSLIELAQIRYEQERYEEANQLYQRYTKVGDTTPRSLWLGLNIADRQGDNELATNYALQLKNNFPQSPEAKMLQEMN